MAQPTFEVGQYITVGDYPAVYKIEEIDTDTGVPGEHILVIRRISRRTGSPVGAALLVASPHCRLEKKS